jgi:hypothetical protein
MKHRITLQRRLSDHHLNRSSPPHTSPHRNPKPILLLSVLRPLLHIRPNNTHNTKPPLMRRRRTQPQSQKLIQPAISQNIRLANQPDAGMAPTIKGAAQPPSNSGDPTSYNWLFRLENKP